MRPTWTRGVDALNRFALTLAENRVKLPLFPFQETPAFFCSLQKKMSGDRQPGEKEA